MGEGTGLRQTLTTRYTGQSDGQLADAGGDGDGETEGSLNELSTSIKIGGYESNEFDNCSPARTSERTFSTKAERPMKLGQIVRDADL